MLEQSPIHTAGETHVERARARLLAHGRERAKRFEALRRQAAADIRAIAERFPRSTIPFAFTSGGPCSVPVGSETIPTSTSRLRA